MKEPDKFDDFFELYADNNPKDVEAKADLMEKTDICQNSIGPSEKVGIFQLANTLVQRTNQSRIHWLQHIAAAINKIPGDDEKFFEISNYSDILAMEPQGLKMLAGLANRDFFAEPKDIEQLLTSIWLPKAQVDNWLNHLNLTDKNDADEEKWKRVAKELLAEHGNKDIALVKLLERFGQAATEKGKRYLHVSKAGIYLGIVGWPEDENDKQLWKNYRAKVGRHRKKGEKLLSSR